MADPIGNSQFGQRIPNPEQAIQDAFGDVVPVKNDPAFQPPRDPLAVGRLKSRTAVIHRDVPLVVVQTGWDIAQVRKALVDLVIGIFDAPSQLVDSAMGDSRVSSALLSRSSVLMGAPLKFEIPKRFKGSKIAQECHDAWVEHWPSMASEPILSDMQIWGAMLGFWSGQILWDTSGDVIKPYLYPWHPRYTYYHWTFRRYIALTMDGSVPIEPGDGHWILHAPYGEYRGWMRGAIRPIAPWWLARNYALRDWARYSERHGLPIAKGITPQGADPASVQEFRNQLANIGQECVVQVQQSQDVQIGSYDFEWVETKGTGWEVFPGLKSASDDEITLALLGQTLTTQVKEGSLAAARVHSDVRQNIVEADARGLSQTVYTQVARPFAALNFGDPDLAPRAIWNVKPDEDKEMLARAFQGFATGVNQSRQAGKQAKSLGKLGKRFGLPLRQGDFTTIDPTQVEARAVAAGNETAEEEQP
jgi:uncharacterized protein DUF935